MRLRRIRMYLMLAVAATAVIVSWMVPESPAPAREPIIPVSSSTCTTGYSGPPSYGTREVSLECSP